MAAPRPLRSLASLGFVAVALVTACDGDDPGPIAPPDPLEPVPALTVADLTGSLEAWEEGQPQPVDSLEVDVPAGRRMALILESATQFYVQYGVGTAASGFGGPFATLTSIEGPADPLIRVFNVDGDAVGSYHVRVVALDEQPEHAEAALSVGEFSRELVDPVLDVDVFSIDLPAGGRFAIEMDSVAGAPVTVSVVPPSGASFYAFIAAGGGAAVSDAFESVAGEYDIVVYSAGFTPDTEAEYRFRLIAEDE